MVKATPYKKTKSIKRTMDYETTPEDKSRRVNFVGKTKSVFMYHIGYRLIGYSLAIAHEVYIYLRRKNENR